jgi:hypothetical protein
MKQSASTCRSSAGVAEDAIIKGEPGLPIRYRSFAKSLHKIARHAKI